MGGMANWSVRGSQWPRQVGWGVALPVVTASYLWVFGAFSLAYEPGRANVFSATTLHGSMVWAAATVAAVMAFTAVAPRLAAYLAAVGLVALGLYEIYVAVVFPEGVYSAEWYGWILGAVSRSGVWVISMVSLVAGFSLTRRTIVADLRTHGTLTARVRQLTQTRAEAVDAAAAELRRLERDLHDGAQARLVALGINLRTVEKLMKTSPLAAEAMIAECRETSSQALADLRNLVRGIYPPVLADRGLADAVRALALDCPVPAVAETDLPGRPPVPVESAVYFAVAELLNNIAKHADATCAMVRMYYTAGLLRVEITDDGHGGADPANGTGLRGIERRLGAFDGILAVNSPVGGPTIVVIEVPCELSSPKISTC